MVTVGTLVPHSQPRSQPCPSNTSKSSSRTTRSNSSTVRFADMRGVQHHVTFPQVHRRRQPEDGKMFDGSSINGWRGIQNSDMVLLPDPSTAFLDPFTADPTPVLTCDILDPTTMQAYTRDPRGVAKRAEAFLKASGIAEQASSGRSPSSSSSTRCASATRWATPSSTSIRRGALELQPRLRRLQQRLSPDGEGRLFWVAADGLHDLRAEMCKTLESVGIETEVHHHEVANAGQCEIGTKFNSLTKKADDLLTMKQIIKNVAHRNGKTATMPKPIVGDNGAVCTAHVAGEGRQEPVLRRRLRRPVADGAVVHRRHLQARPRHQRLLQFHDQQQLQAPGAGLRGAGDAGVLGIQPPRVVPHPVANPKARRIEMRFPDPMNSGYLTFALLMAGLDGIRNQIDLGAPSDKDLYDLLPEEEKGIPTVCHSLDQALDALDKDREFLKAGGVFTDDFIDAYIGLKMKEVTVPRGDASLGIPDVLHDLTQVGAEQVDPRFAPLPGEDRRAGGRADGCVPSRAFGWGGSGASSARRGRATRRPGGASRSSIAAGRTRCVPALHEHESNDREGCRL